ncbi:MAG: PAS domain-containing protein [Lachnospiraceae bacterium]
MDTKRIESFKEFAKYLEYPMVVFEAESGNVLDINYEAEVLLGSDVQTIRIEPGRALTKLNFWEMLHGKKSLMWHRIRMFADDKEYLVCGLVNEATVEDRLIYTVLFELRADLDIGSLTLERIVNHAGIVAVHMGQDGKGGYQVEYVSKNINQYGYTRNQMYDKGIDINDIVCPEDLEGVQESIARAAEKHLDEGSLECRIVTEERDLIPVRLLLYYIYNDAGNLTDFEMLIFDRRDYIRRNMENEYLSKAISKMKSVVLVKSYHAGKRTLKYISANAGMVGMNVEALKKGYKLTEDYIHPEDRDSVIDAIYQAVANGVTDYVHTYRMVRDDGKQIWVENEVTITRISDGEAEISFLLTDITEQKNMESEMAAAVENGEQVQETGGHTLNLITIDKEDTEILKQFQLMAETLSQNADYYSVVVNAEGRLLTTPAGPVNDMGQFYDLFERPQLKEQFAEVSLRAKEQMIPQSTSFDVDRMNVHMIFAPLLLHNTVTAYWVLTSFAKNGDEILGDVIGQQWHLANAIAKCFYAEEAVQNETRLRKLTELQLHREQQERHVIQDMIDTMAREGESGMGEMCQKAGHYLSVSDIGLYIENKETGNAEKYFVWNQAGEDLAFFETMAMSVSECKMLDELLTDSPMIVAAGSPTEPFLQEMLRQTGMKTIIIHAMESALGERGYIVFADKGRVHAVDNKELHFVDTVTHMFENIIFSNKNVVKKDVVKEGFLEAYDHIRDAVFVKDNRSGEIIFANKAMDKLFGYSLVGMQAGEVVNDQLEQYRMMQGIRKRFIANKKVTKWQSYMKELDQIMNIVEIHMELFSGMDCSLFILKKNKNK